MDLVLGYKGWSRSPFGPASPVDGVAHAVIVDKEVSACGFDMRDVSERPWPPKVHTPCRACMQLVTSPYWRKKYGLA